MDAIGWRLQTIFGNFGVGVYSQEGRNKDRIRQFPIRLRQKIQNHKHYVKRYVFQIVLSEFGANMAQAQVELLGVEKGNGTTLTRSHDTSTINTNPVSCPHAGLVIIILLTSCWYPPSLQYTCIHTYRNVITDIVIHRGPVIPIVMFLLAYIVISSGVAKHFKYGAKLHYILANKIQSS